MTQCLCSHHCYQAALDALRLKHKNRILKEQRHRELEEAKAIAAQQSIRDSLDAQMKRMLAPPSHVDKWFRAGEWRRDSAYHWEVRLKEGFETKFDKAYSEAKDLVRMLKNENDIHKLENRWKRIGGGPLRAVFPKNPMYDLIAEDTMGPRGKKRTSLTPKDKISVVLDFEMKNSNDAELENEDLLEIKEGMKSQPTSPYNAGVKNHRKTLKSR